MVKISAPQQRVIDLLKKDNESYIKTDKFFDFQKIISLGSINYTRRDTLYSMIKKGIIKRKFINDYSTFILSQEYR